MSDERIKTRFYRDQPEMPSGYTNTEVCCLLEGLQTNYGFNFGELFPLDSTRNANIGLFLSILSQFPDGANKLAPELLTECVEHFSVAVSKWINEQSYGKAAQEAYGRLEVNDVKTKLLNAVREDLKRSIELNILSRIALPSW
jgi:hypothetical protein